MNALATWMAETGETDETVAAKAGVSRVQISRIRRNISRPSLQLAEKLEGLTGRAAWDFLKPGGDQSAQDAAA